jgi:hypothetical protein
VEALLTRPALQRLAAEHVGQFAAGAATTDVPCRDGHQFQRPRSATVEGTSRVRTRNASMRIPMESEARMSR